jgi:predicted O-linked N-acetylglucosamine transferase (SPINDLY family)
MDSLDSAPNIKNQDIEDFGSAFNHYRTGQFDKAQSILRKIIESHPDNFESWHLLGIISYMEKDYDSSVKNLKKAIELNPNNADAYYNLGNTLVEKGQMDDALACFQQAILNNPALVEAYINIGNILREKGQINEAQKYYETAIKHNPFMAEAYNNLGSVAMEKENLHEAIFYYQKAVQLNPSYIEALNNLGNSLVKENQIDEAIAVYKRVLQLNPACIDSLINIGNAFHLQGNNRQAMEMFDKALFYRAGYFPAQWSRCMAQLLTIYPDESTIIHSRRVYEEELRKLHGISFETAQEIDEAARTVGSRQPFLLPYQGQNDRKLQQIYGELVCRTMSLKYPQWSKSLQMPELLAGQPIRIGIVSGFFQHHSNWKIPIKGWIENLDKQRFSIYCYYTGRKKDDVTKSAKTICTRFVEDIYSFGELCSTIRNDNLHILIYPEIGMDSMTVRLASLKLAPVQCTSWGHPNTSGLPTIDYFLSSDLMELPDSDDHYTERLIRLPNLSIHYTPLEAPPVSLDRKVFGLRPDSVLYFCPQSLVKYLPQYDQVFPRIAEKIRDCQFLFITDKNISQNLIERFRSRIYSAFRSFNLKPENHIVFLPFLKRGEYHAMNNLADVYLDSIGWSGCNTTFEAIACNLPVVTLPGFFMRGRHSSAILRMMGITETIASTLDEYIDIAVRLGGNNNWRREIQDNISKNKHLLYRDTTCIRALEDFLEQLVINE